MPPLPPPQPNSINNTQVQVPIPISYRPEYREQQRQKQVVQSAQQTEIQTPSEEEQIRSAYIRTYGSRVGYEYYQLDVLERKLKMAEATGQSNKKINEIKSDIANQTRSIRSAQVSQSTGGGTKLKGEGISTTIKKQSGTVVIEKGKTVSYLPTGGYSPVGSQVPSEKFFLQSSTQQSQQQLVGGKSIESAMIQTDFGNQKPIATGKIFGGNVYKVNSTQYVEQIPASYQKLPIGTKASSLPANYYVLPEKVKQQTRKYEDSISTGQNRQEAFFSDIYTGIEKFENQRQPKEDIIGIGLVGKRTKAVPLTLEKIGGALARPTVQTSELILGTTPFYYKPYSTITGLTTYGSEAIKDPFGRTIKTGEELGGFLKEKGPYGFIELYAGAKTTGFFLKPVERLGKNIRADIEETRLGIKNLEKNYRIQEIPTGRGSFTTLIVREKITGRFAGTSKTPIEIIPMHTLIQEPSSLRNLEGRPAFVTHSTPSFEFGNIRERVIRNIQGKPSETVLSAPKATGIRAKLELQEFYRGTPEISSGIPRAQGGYFGLSETVRSGNRFSLFPTNPKILLEKLRIEKTGEPLRDIDVPAGFSPKERLTVQYAAKQEQFPGRTTLSAQQLSGLRPFGSEAEVVTPPRRTVKSSTGRDFSVGSILEKKRDLGVRYYYEQVLVPDFIPSNFRSFIENSPFAKEPVRIKIVETKTRPFSVERNPSGNFDVKSPVSVIRSREIGVREYGPRELVRGISLRFTDRNIRSDYSERELFSRVDNRSRFSEVFNRNDFRNVSRYSNNRSSERRILEPRVLSISKRDSLSERNDRNNYRVRYRPSPVFSPPRITSRPNVPIVPIRSINEKVNYRNQESFTRERLRPSFRVQYRQKGKVRTLEGEFTRSDALAVGSSLIGNTLRASFRTIKGTGIAIEKGIKSVPVSTYLSKKGFYVQQRGTRLSSFGERREIQSARRMKRGALF